MDFLSHNTRNFHMKEYAINCHCGSPAHLQSNSVLYGKEYGNGKAYICDRFPACRGSVGVHPNGKPLGSIPDDETKGLRRQLHATIDHLWMNRPHNQRKKYRGKVYGWLRHITGMTAEECHIGNFDEDTCRRVLTLIEENSWRAPKDEVKLNESF